MRASAKLFRRGPEQEPNAEKQACGNQRVAGVPYENVRLYTHLLCRTISDEPRAGERAGGISRYGAWSSGEGASQ